MIYCLDTSVIIAVMRNQAKPIAKLKLLDAADIKIPEVVRAKLLFGCLKSKHPSQERAKVEHVINPFDWVPFADDAAEHYASIRNDLERKGNVIGPNDLLI
ncbi:MAG: type II toxin-antitoxin system VapC family toxin, partial [Verrucomicrobiota bacterium]